MGEPYIYKDNKHKIYRTTVLVIIIIIYIFFFTSEITMPAKVTSKSETTKIGQQVEFGDNRQYTLISATYSDDQSLLEIVMQIQNNNLDGIDDYYFVPDVIGGSLTDTETKEILNDQIITVVQIQNIKRFDEVELYFAAKTSENVDDITDEELGIMILNKHNISYKNIDTNKTKTDYLIERLDTVISEYEKNLEWTNTKNNDAQSKIESLEKENIELEKSKAYITTVEYENALLKIDENKKEIENTEKQITTYKIKIKDIETQINEAKQKRQGLQTAKISVQQTYGQ